MLQGIKVIEAASNRVVPLPITSGTSLLATTPLPSVNGLNLDRLSMPESEMPEVIVPDHLLTLQLSPPHLLETWEEGHLKQISKGIGSVTHFAIGIQVSRQMGSRSGNFSTDA